MWVILPDLLDTRRDMINKTTWACQNLDWVDLGKGHTVSFYVTLSRDAVTQFSSISGDFSPIHIDESYGNACGFGGNIVHGMLISSYFSTVVGMFLPGKRALLLSQNTQYYVPVPVNEKIMISAKITRLNKNIRVFLMNALAIHGGIVAVKSEIVVKMRKK
jgi:3-hydroxybutyryl-CoA dehydratase